ncbi:unnamed protein product [Brachionus calyciflorus]|uniref:Uncharacterized protein n=1 Tax=Brachionus calyciflorus TaxID=104777 RepID=A0A813YGC2_9BILA|nr:unnamed protein product [Brachionus calyciflorus]
MYFKIVLIVLHRKFKKKKYRNANYNTRENLQVVDKNKISVSPREIIAPESVNSNSKMSELAYGSVVSNRKSSIIPSSSIQFHQNHRELLNINFENTLDLDQFFESKFDDEKFDESLLILNLIRHDIRTLDERPELLNELSDDEKTIGLLLNKVVAHDPLRVSIRESFTSNFLNYLLIKMQFAQFPLIMNTQPRYSFELDGVKLTGKPEFSIEKKDQIKCIFVDENRHLSNLKLATEFSESQIAAEIVAAAFTNYAHPLSSTMLQDQMIYAVRVIGPRFTFYKSIVSKSYLDSLTLGIDDVERQMLNIYRYPPNDEQDTLFGHDYSNNKHRESIPRRKSKNVIKLEDTSFSSNSASFSITLLKKFN